MTRREARAFAELGRRDGEAAGVRALQVLPRSDAAGRLGRAVERELAQLSHTAADALERGASGSVIETYQAAWRAGFEGALDDLAARLLRLMPDETQMGDL